MTDPSDLDAMIEAVGWLFGITVRPDWHAAVRQHLAVSIDHARNVTEFPLPDEAEPAPVFTA